MRKITWKRVAKGGVVFLTVASVLLFVLHSSADDKSTATKTSSASSAATSETNATVGKGGSALWSENCARCHNMRSPSIYTDAEWDVAMHHMRVRANLTAEEHKKILEFLKSSK